MGDVARCSDGQAHTDYHNEGSTLLNCLVINAELADRPRLGLGTLHDCRN